MERNGDHLLIATGSGENAGVPLARYCRERDEAFSFALNDCLGSTSAAREFAPTHEHLLIVAFRLEMFAEELHRSLDLKVLAGEDIESGEAFIWKCMDGDMGLGYEHHSTYSPIILNCSMVRKNVRWHDLCHF